MLDGQWIFARVRPFLLAILPEEVFWCRKSCKSCCGQSCDIHLDLPSLGASDPSGKKTTNQPFLFHEKRNCNQAATFASPIRWRPGTPVVNPFLLLQQLAGAQVFLPQFLLPPLGPLRSVDKLPGLGPWDGHGTCEQRIQKRRSRTLAGNTNSSPNCRVYSWVYRVYHLCSFESPEDWNLTSSIFRARDWDFSPRLSSL